MMAKDRPRLLYGVDLDCYGSVWFFTQPNLKVHYRIKHRVDRMHRLRDVRI